MSPVNITPEEREYQERLALRRKLGLEPTAPPIGAEPPAATPDGAKPAQATAPPAATESSAAESNAPGSAFVVQPSLLSKPAREYQEHAEKRVSVRPFRRGDEGEMLPLNWLWKGKIPLGTLTLFIGDPELGKSTIACDLAARVTTGDKDWPDEAPRFGPRNVVILASEDHSDRILRPRLKLSGADLTRVHFLPTDEIFFVDVDENMKRLKQLVWAHQPALIIFDPLDEFISQWTDVHKGHKVRSGLRGLRQLASKHDIAVIGILHLNKREGEGLSGLKRALHSVAFGALARSALAVAKDFNSGASYFGPAKASYAKKGTVLRYTFEVLPHPVDAEDTITRIQWEGEYEVVNRAGFPGGSRP